MWRVVLLVGVVIALVLGGIGLWQDQHDFHCDHVTISGQSVVVAGNCRTTSAHHADQ
jgi:hypothetical protein